MSFTQYLLEYFYVWPVLYVALYYLLDPFYTASVKKIGGLTFVRYGKLCFSFCFTNKGV